MTPQMYTFEEQLRKPLRLDSDLGNGQHLREHALLGRSERIRTSDAAPLSPMIAPFGSPNHHDRRVRRTRVIWVCVARGT